MVVDSWFVSQKIFINIKWGLNWPVSNNFSLDLWHIFWKRKNVLGIVQIFFVLSWISCHTLFSALRGWFYCSTRFILSGGMMVTRWKAVRFAPFGSVIKPSCTESTIFIMSPCRMWPSSSTSHAAAYSTATNQILSRNSNLFFLATSNTNPITHCLNSPKSPTRSASTLVSNFFYGLTIGPLYSRVKVLWEWL